MFCPAMVRLVMSLDPETPEQVACDVAIAKYAVIWFGSPDSNTSEPNPAWLSASEEPIVTDTSPSAVANGFCIVIGVASISLPDDNNGPVSMKLTCPSGELIDMALASPPTVVVA